MSRKLWIAGWLTLLPSVAIAQSNADSATYRRAQTLVNDGNAAMGRALVDSMVAKAVPGTNPYAEALYWRAVLSATAADAEMDYRRIVVDYPLSPRVEDVLLRLAQLELARADYDGALQHLNRLTLEHPAGATRARAGYWVARVLFEKNDIPRACAANADALARTNPDDTELRNQISYLNQRCIGVVLAPPAPAMKATAVDSATVARVDTSAKPVSVAPNPTPAPPAAAGESGNAVQRIPAEPLASPRDVKPSTVSLAEVIPATKTSMTKAAPTEVLPEKEGEGYSVQIAAYNVKSQAEAMVAKLKTKGYEARVSGTSAPFRVRIGHYVTQSQATAVMRSLRAKKIDSFVVKAEPR